MHITRRNFLKITGLGGAALASSVGYGATDWIISMEQQNKAIVSRWFKEFWGNPWNPEIVDELAAPDMLMQYSLHEPRRGREDIKAFMTNFRRAFPDLNFWGTADLIAEGDYVVGRWKGGGTHIGSAFNDFRVGSLPENSGRKMLFTGTTVLRIDNGRITEEIGLDDGVTALRQLGLISDTGPTEKCGVGVLEPGPILGI